MRNKDKIFVYLIIMWILSVLVGWAWNNYFITISLWLVTISYLIILKLKQMEKEQ